jgi:tight adherence protein C
VGIAFAAACVAVCFVVAMSRIYKILPVDDRDYMDPLPPGLKLLWPLVNVFAHYVGQHLSVEYLEHQKRLLQRSELMYLMTPEQFIGLQMVSALLFAMLVYIGFLIVGSPAGFMPLLAGLFGAFFPLIMLNDRKKKREKQIVRALPVFLDYITLAVQSGMNLSGALLQVVEKGPKGPLKSELQLVIRDNRAGKPLIEAFRTMADRVSLKEIDSLVTAIALSERTGSSLGETLKIQANQRRVERFQRAEKLALEAPVKLVFPLVAFIFPTTFLILGFPIAMKIMYGL